MAWIYLQESEESLRPYQAGSGRLPIVKESLVLSASFFPGCIEEKSTKRQSGMTLPLFEDQCFHQLTSSPEASHARISALRGFAKVWRESALVYSSILSDLPKKRRPQFYSSKMLRECRSSFLLSGLKLRSLAISAGMGLYLPLMSEQDIKERDGSYWPTLVVSRKTYDRQKNGSLTLSLWELWKRGKLPTPKASDHKRMSGSPSDLRRVSPSLASYWKATTGTSMPISFCEWIMGYSIRATQSEPWATEWFRAKLKRRSRSLKVA